MANENEDSLYKRIEDQKWRERVEERIVNLQSSEASQNDRHSDAEERLTQHEHLLEGHPEDKGDTGIKGDIHDLTVSYNELRALMMPDHLGGGGIINRLRALERQAGVEEKATESRWKFLTAIAVAIITTAGLVLTNLDKIEKFLNRNQKKDPLANMIEKAKHPRGGKRYRVRYVPPRADDPDLEVDGSANQ